MGAAVRYNNLCLNSSIHFTTDILGCQYGDKQTWCSDISAISCYVNDENCCQHCLQYETGIEGKNICHYLLTPLYQNQKGKK